MCKGFEQGRTPRKCREARREGKGGEGYAWVFKNKEAGQRPLSLSRRDELGKRAGNEIVLRETQLGAASSNLLYISAFLGVRVEYVIGKSPLPAHDITINTQYLIPQTRLNSSQV
jgi:hypothetical protein